MIRRALASACRKYVRATPSHPGRGLILWLAKRLGREPFEHEVAPGVRFRLDLSNPVDMVYWKGIYEADDDLRPFLSLLKPGMTFVDVGANYGLYSLQVARVVGPGGRVVAFEPSPRVYPRLADHVRLNAAANVATHQIAVADRVGTATFYLGRNDSIGSLQRPTAGDSTQVPTTTLDRFLAEAGIDRVDAVKVDVEGGEMNVLRGMRELLSRDAKPVLLFEHNFPALAAAGSSAEELFGAIVAHGYDAYLVEKGKMHRVTRLAEPGRSYEEPLSNYIFLPARRTKS